MSIIQAASMSCRTMADGTLRIQADIEPRHAQAAFALFGTPGTQMALARLLTDAEKDAALPEPVAETPKGGLLSKWLAIRCGEREFQRWLAQAHPLLWNARDEGTTAEGNAAIIVRKLCGVLSRAEIDSCESAAARFHERIRGPYAKWLISRGVTA